MRHIRFRVLAALACAVAMPSCLHAALITYMGSQSSNANNTTYSVDYVITTDGTLGALVKANIISYSAMFKAAGGQPVGFDSSNSYSELTLTGGLSATTDNLLFNFAPSQNLRLINNYSASYVEFSQSGLVFNSGVTGFRGTPLTGVQTIGAAVVPEPATWAMTIGGFALIGSAMRRRKANITASCA